MSDAELQEELRLGQEALDRMVGGAEVAGFDGDAQDGAVYAAEAWLARVRFEIGARAIDAKRAVEWDDQVGRGGF
jgi:hypothetical protein